MKASKDKKIKNNIIKDVRNLFTPKIFFEAIKNRVIRGIRILFEVKV